MATCEATIDVGGERPLPCVLEPRHTGPHKSQAGTTWDHRGLWVGPSYDPNTPQPPPSRRAEAIKDVIGITLAILVWRPWSSAAGGS